MIVILLVFFLYAAEQGYSPGQPWVGALTTGGPQGESGRSGYRDSENIGSAEKHRKGQLFLLFSQYM